MSQNLAFVLGPLAAYLIGSVPFAVLISNMFSLADPRNVGSGNPGATNVLRSGNKAAAALTLLADMLKGAVPVYLALHWQASSPLVALVAIAAFLGHLFPVFLGFKGGKGVATALGVFIALSWKLFLCFGLVWLVIAAWTRYSSLAALCASAVTGVASFAVFNQPHQLQLIGAVFCIVALLFLRHRDNIERLKTGRESKIGSKSV